MTKHTPVPWKVGATTTLNGEAVSEIMSGDDIVAISMNYSEADARLIAAAPELLAALIAITEEAGDLYGHTEGPGTINRMTFHARQAIAKAEGKAREQ